MRRSATSAEKMTRTFHRDEVVFEEGSEGHHMYLVIAGAVKIMKATDGGQALLTTLGTGDMFGEMALLDSGIRTATAVAAEDETRLMAIDQGRFVYLVSQQPAFALSVMRVLSRRLVTTNAQVQYQLGEQHERK